ncbi:MAG: hypothetical protein U0744_08625 [Gemmataceae bacterium]
MPGGYRTQAGTSGWVRTSFGVTLVPTTNTATAAAQQADGKFLVGGTVVNVQNDDFAIARYLPDNGTFDDTFINFGSTLVDFGDVDRLTSIAVDPNGRIASRDQRNEIRRRGSAGRRRLDTTFSGDGLFTYDFGGQTPSRGA